MGPPLTCSLYPVSHLINLLSFLFTVFYYLSQPSIFSLLSLHLSLYCSSTPTGTHTHTHTHTHTLLLLQHLPILQFHSGCIQVIKRQNGKQTVINLKNNKKHLPRSPRNTQKKKS